MVDRINLEGSYKFFKRNQSLKVDKSDYINIVNGLMKFMMNKIFKGYDIKLGAKLGKIGVRGRKIEPVITKDGEIRGIAPDWGATKKLQAANPEAKANRTIVYCFNEHSDGVKYEYFWSKLNVIVTNKTYYGLTFSRFNRRELARRIKGGQEFLVLPPKYKNKFYGKVNTSIIE